MSADRREVWLSGTRPGRMYESWSVITTRRTKRAPTRTPLSKRCTTARTVVRATRLTTRLTRRQLDEQAALAHGLHSHLTDLAAAVARCEDSTYGSCEWCRQYIQIERLAVFPAATRCVPCKRLTEHR